MTNTKAHNSSLENDLNIDTEIAFNGLGAMGWPMAKNLVLSGYSVTVFDQQIEKVEKFTLEVGGKAAKTPQDLVKNASVILSILPTSAALKDLLFGKSNLQQNIMPGAILIDMCSGVPQETIEIAKRLELKNVSIIDAPVSGGVRKAVTGELAIVAGGDPDKIKTVSPILNCVGRSLRRSGEVGSAHATKALNNLAQAGSFLIALEALLIGKKFGLNPEGFVDYLNESSGMNYNTQQKFKQFILSGSFNAGFSIGLLAKDVGIAVNIAKSMDSEIPFSSLCNDIWVRAAESLGESSDHTEIAKFCADFLNVDLK